MRQRRKSRSRVCFLVFLVFLVLGKALHWWTEWAPALGYIPATGAGEEDTLWRCPNMLRIIWRVSYPCHLIGWGMILHKCSLLFWHTVRGCPPLLSGLMKCSPKAMSIFASRIQQCMAIDSLEVQTNRTGEQGDVFGWPLWTDKQAFIGLERKLAQCW